MTIFHRVFGVRFVLVIVFCLVLLPLFTLGRALDGTQINEVVVYIMVATVTALSWPVLLFSSSLSGCDKILIMSMSIGVLLIAFQYYRALRWRSLISEVCGHLLVVLWFELAIWQSIDRDVLARLCS